MVRKMLEAVHELLEVEDINVKKDYDLARINAARTILGKIIEDMRENGLQTPKLNPTKPDKKPQVSAAYAVILNDDRTLRIIEGLDIEAIVVLDGKEMTHAQAIGKTFQTASIK